MNRKRQCMNYGDGSCKMREKYFPRDKTKPHDGCVRNSLANLLYELGDKATACKAYRLILHHPLLNKEKGVCFITLPKLVYDVTNRRYHGKLFLSDRNSEDYNYLYMVRKRLAKGKYLDQIMSAVDWAMQNNCYQFGVYQGPAPFILDLTDNKKERHAVVMREDRKVIDNGKVISAKEVLSYFEMENGVLTLEQKL